MTAIERLADRIEHALRMGDRRFVLDGAELDWVVEALTRNKTRTRLLRTPLEHDD